MVAAVRRGESQRSVARRYQVRLSTVQFWVRRAEGQRLDRMDWCDRPSGPHLSVTRTPRPVEDFVLQIRRELRERSDLGEFGAARIHEELGKYDLLKVPHERTIHRILDRRGVLDRQRRIRRQPPPVGWYLPDVADGRSEVDLFDIIEGLVIKNGPQVEVLTGISLHGALSGSWPHAGITAPLVRDALLEHWHVFGLPAYAQFDNDTVFQGPHQYPDTIGSVTRLCLSLGVMPVFVPPRETGFQAAIESFNGRWQAKTWARFHHESLRALQLRSARYLKAHRQRTIARREVAPERQPFPARWKLDPYAQPQGKIIFLRRTDTHSQVNLLGHKFEGPSSWPHRLLRCEVDLNRGVIGFYALRRRAPDQQPLLWQVPYVWPKRSSRE